MNDKELSELMTVGEDLLTVIEKHIDDGNWKQAVALLGERLISISCDRSEMGAVGEELIQMSMSE